MCVVAGSVAVFLAIGFVLVGVVSGYRPVVAVSGSMADAAPAGSLLVAAPTDRVSIGDVLLLRGDGRPTVAHRVVELTPGPAGGVVAVTKGDANAAVDPGVSVLDGSQLTVRWVVPWLGRALLALRSPLVAGPLAAALALWGATIVSARLRRVPAAGAVGPTPAGRRTGERLVAGSALGGGAAVLGLVAALAVFTDTADATGNQFSTAACYDARLDGVQSGAITSTSDGVSTFAVAAVDPSRSFVVFSASSASGEPDESTVMVRLAGPTSLEVVRASDGAPPEPVQIEWSLVHYACGVTVQRGTVSGGGAATLDVPIAPVDPDASFVLLSGLPPAGSTAFEGELLHSAVVHDADTVRIRAASALSPGMQFAWQVVTFDDPTEASVQTATATLGGGSASSTVTLAEPVLPASTMLLAGVRSANTGATIGDRLVRVRLLDATTIEVTRTLTAGSVDVDLQVVEFRDGTTVQRGVLDLAAAQDSATAAMPPVAVNRSSAIATVVVAGGASGGSTAMSADDVVGEGTVAVRLLDSRTVELVRDTATASASHAWQVVTWAGPDWADPSQPFRRRIDVVAGGVATPSGYTTSVAVDHAALVGTGQSVPSGDDLRIWRHDGATWTELDRVLDDASAWNANDTTLWFRAPEPIGAGGTASYWLYFGDTTPSSPPAEPANVWLAVEGFDAGNLGIFEDRTGGTGWYDASPWTRRFEVTIPAGTAATNLVDEPVLVRVTSAALAAVAQADGSDVRFAAADGATPLAHELESYDPLTGSLSAWVRVPLVTAAVDTTLWLYAGAPDAPAQQDPRAVWTDGFATWQLAADPAGPAPALDDSGRGRLDGVAFADVTLVTDPTGAAVALDGTDDRLESAPFTPPRSSLTVAAWFRVDDDTREQVVATQGDPTSSGAFELAVVPTVGDPEARFRLRAGGQLVEVRGGSLPTGGWHHVAATWDGPDLRLFVDGVEVDSDTVSGEVSIGTPTGAVLGAASDGSRALDGAIGQVRLDATAWTSARVDFVAANLLTPATTAVVGGATTGVWFDQGDWNLRRPLGIESDLVAGPLTDFPVLVEVTDVDLAAGLQANAADLVFTDADGVTRLDHQVEAWDPLTGALTAWVRVPALDGDDDGLLFLYLGNPTADDQQDPVGVWGPDADLVLLD